MKTRLVQPGKMNLFLKITALLFCITIIAYACQNKKTTKSMSEKKIIKEPDSTSRLLTVANLEQTDSGRNVIAWFFETPQVFEFSLGAEQSQQFLKILKEAKEKQLPVNIHSTTIRDKNSIDIVTPATEDQINRYNQEKAKRQQPVSVPPPAHN
jgi:hypothetical protein